MTDELRRGDVELASLEMNEVLARINDHLVGIQATVREVTHRLVGARDYTRNLGHAATPDDRVRLKMVADELDRIIRRLDDRKAS